MPERKVGLALGGGAARGLAHAGVGDVDAARDCFRTALDEEAGHLQAALELEMLGQEG